jgi:hypothetical protein
VELINQTPFAAERLVTGDGDGRELLVVLAKATYELGSGQPVLAERADGLRLADEYRGEPGKTSLRFAAEAAWFKPAAEVLVIGSARTRPHERSEAVVSLRVGRVRKAVRVIGDRTRGRSGITVSEPEPFTEMPLVYERAYGGSDPTAEPPAAWPENPVGIGFRSRGSLLPLAGTVLPNLEDLSDPGAARTLGFGPLAPSWWPRAGYAGTYGADWQRERMPLLPADFDARFHQTAPADQVLPGYLEGGEPLSLTMVRPDGGGYSFALPTFAPVAVLRLGGERSVLPLRCDSIMLDTDAERLWLVARAAVSVHGRLDELAWIKLEEQRRGDA